MIAGAARDRVVGCVLGLALGDALGAPFEFRRAADIPRPLPALELPWMGLPSGSTTDDTAMARNLARSLAERGRFDPDDVVARHLAWLATDPPDVGNLTRRVLSRVASRARGAGEEVGADPGLGGVAFQEAERVWTERGPEVSAGNGSVMYCSPLGAFLAFRPDELTDAAPALSALTHHDARCRTACLAVTRTVAALVRGEGPLQAMRAAVASHVDLEGGEELEFLVDAVGTSRPIDGPDQGFCLFAAAAGLQALGRAAAGAEGRIGPGDVEGALRHVVALGGDTDTNGAVAGALLGAAAGRAGLPGAWLDRLSGGAEIENEAEALALGGPGGSTPAERSEAD